MLFHLDYYTQTMLGLKVDQEVLGELVKSKVPAVWQTMNQHDVMWTLVVSRWFICLYVDVLPVEVWRQRLFVVKKWISDKLLRNQQSWNNFQSFWKYCIMILMFKIMIAIVIFSDGAKNMGLSFLWGIQDSVPCGFDSNSTQSEPHFTGKESPRNLRRL